MRFLLPLLVVGFLSACQTIKPVVKDDTAALRAHLQKAEILAAQQKENVEKIRVIASQMQGNTREISSSLDRMSAYASTFDYKSTRQRTLIEKLLNQK